MERPTPATSYEEFDTEAYYRNYRSSSVAIGYEGENQGVQAVIKFILDSFGDVFSTGSVFGDRLIDIGTGVSLMSFISASRYVKEIHLTDLLPQHIELMQRWLEGEDRESNIEEYVMGKEDDGTSKLDRLSDLREKVKSIKSLDVTNQVDDGMKESFDVLTSSFCFEVASKSVDEYIKVVENVSTLVKPGGYMVFAGTLEESNYTVGEYEFWNANITRDDVKSTLRAAGLNLMFWRETTFADIASQKLRELADFKCMFVAAAQKTS